VHHVPKILVFLAILLLCFLTSPIFASVLNVPGVFPTIQSAVNGSVSGDTISISAGDYYETINLHQHALTIAGPWFFSADTTDIVAVRLHGDTTQSNQRILTVSTALDDEVIVAGCQIMEGGALAVGGGVLIDFANVQFNHVYFKNNQADRGGAVYTSGSQVLFHACSFDSNEASDGAGGAILANGGFIILEETRFNNNLATNGAGAFSGGAPPGVIQDCVFHSNQSGGAYGSVTLDASSDVRGRWTVENNTFLENVGGWGAALSCWGIDTLEIRNNDFIGNHASLDVSPQSNGDGGALVCVLGNWAQITGNTFRQNLADDWGGVMILAMDGILKRNRFIANEALYFPVLYVTLLNDRSGNL